MTKKVISNKVFPAPTMATPECQKCKHFLIFKSIKQKILGGFSPLCVAQGYKFTPNCHGSVFCLSLYTQKNEATKNNEEVKK